MNGCELIHKDGQIFKMLLISFSFGQILSHRNTGHGFDFLYKTNDTDTKMFVVNCVFTGMRERIRRGIQERELMKSSHILDDDNYEKKKNKINTFI